MKGGATAENWKRLDLLLLCLLLPLLRGSGRGQVLYRFRVERPGPVLLGRPLPLGRKALWMEGPSGRSVPLQWKWVDFPPPPGACSQWARIAWVADRGGLYRLVLGAGRKVPSGLPARGEALQGWVPPFVRVGGRACRGREGASWKGPVVTVRTLQGWGPPGAGLSWSLESQAWASGDVRLTFRLVRFREGPPGVGPAWVPLPPGDLQWSVRRGGGRVEKGRWCVLPEENGMRPGEGWISRLLGIPRGRKGRGPRWGWGDQPRADPARLCRLFLPGGPPFLLPAGRGGLGSQDRALGKAFRKVLERSLSWKDPRDQGDLKDRRGAWINLEYDLPWALVLHFLRTGNPLFLEGAGSCLDHVNSTDRSWTDRPGETADLYLVHGRNHRGNGTETGHTWIQGLLATALLTGDRGWLEMGASTARTLALAVQDRGMGGVSRCLGWPGVGLHSWLEFTRDPVAERALARLARVAARAWTPGAGAFLLPGDRKWTHLWVIPLWVQAGLLGGLALLGAPEKDWADRCSLLLAPPGWRERTPPATLVYREGSPPRASHPCGPAMTALALEGTAWICGSSRAWRKEAHLLARGLEKALRRADAREITLLGRAWPVVAGRLLYRRR